MKVGGAAGRGGARRGGAGRGGAGRGGAGRGGAGQSEDGGRDRVRGGPGWGRAWNCGSFIIIIR